MPRLKTRPACRAMMLLQNQWFNDVDRAKVTLSMYKEHKGERWGWNRFVRDMLFMGCLTGKRIKAAFGEDLCYDESVVFEETSTDMGGHPSSVFPPNESHLVKSLEKYRPKVIVAFGVLACEALKLPKVRVAVSMGNIKVIETCHPAARGSDTLARLTTAATALEAYLAQVDSIRP